MYLYLHTTWNEKHISKKKKCSPFSMFLYKRKCIHTCLFTNLRSHRTTYNVQTNAGWLFLFRCFLYSHCNRCTIIAMKPCGCGAKQFKLDASTAKRIVKRISARANTKRILLHILASSNACSFFLFRISYTYAICTRTGNGTGCGM